MSCYDKLDPRFLHESLRSVYDDSFPKDVYIYCDGKINDELEKVLSEFKPYELNVYHSADNKGLSTAMNYLIDIVKDKDYKYIARMDSDDIVINNRFKVQYDYLEQHPEVDILGGWCVEVNGDGKTTFEKRLPTTHENLKKMMISRSCVIHPTIMMRSHIFKNGVRYNESLFNMQDYELWSRLFAMKYKFANVNEFVLKFRFDGNLIGRRKGFMRFKRELALRYGYLKSNDLMTVPNLFMIFVSSSARLLPNRVLKLLYKTAR
jgi:hypothetical protein